MKEVDKGGKEEEEREEGKEGTCVHPPDAEFHDSIDGVLSCDL